MGTLKVYFMDKIRVVQLNSIMGDLHVGYVDYFAFYDFLPSDAPFGRHVGLCVIFELFFHFSSANIGVFCSF